MKRSYRLSIEICDKEKPESALGILLPIPPMTPHQQLHRMRMDPTWSVGRFAETNGQQSAYFATFPDRAWTRPFAFDLSEGGRMVADHFAASKSRFKDPGADARELAAGLNLDGDDSEGEKLLRIVECVGQKFKYQSGYDNDEPLTCDLLTGNCLSINSAVMRLAQLADVSFAYYIGFFFRDDRSLTADDWHCWIATLTERGYESWDIAHQLRRGGGERVGAGLNPISGTRFAMSVGQDLVFNLPFAKVEVPHLCSPRWIFPDGRSQRSAVRVALEPIDIGSTRGVDPVELSKTLESAGSHAIN